MRQPFVNASGLILAAFEREERYAAEIVVKAW